LPAATSRTVSKRRKYPVRRLLERPPVHPGALMREILETHVKLTIAEAARRMGISRQALHAVLNGAATVTAEMALRFARLTGGEAELFVNMQAGDDLELAQQRLHDELAGIEPWSAGSLVSRDLDREMDGGEIKPGAGPPYGRLAPCAG
jgi:addiction module HigA family antidote